MRSCGFLAVLVLTASTCTSGGGQGETCQAHADCSPGLVCANGFCATGVAGIMPTGKVCVTPECTTDAQCGGTRKCTANKCTCMVDTDCGAFGMKCVGNACVQCMVDGDCFNGQVCVSNVCTAPCMTDGDCGAFNACQGNKCAFVGCKSDRECALANKDVRSKCDMTSTLCYVPCQSDVECSGSLTGGQWNDLVCSMQRCTAAGCDTDADCVASGQRDGQCVSKP